MNSFISTNTDIYYNLALEEFLLKKSSEDFFFLWQSKPVVVVGKHQNPYKEIDFLFTLKKGIKIARRLSGGGSVYQDLGNINFTIIKNTPEGKQINLKEHSKPIFEALKQMGLNVEYSERNDFLIDGMKFSGNAEHVYKDRVLHHGTLLFDSNLKMLNVVLKVKPNKYTDKTIASVRSSVTNIKPFFSKNYSLQSFQEELFKLILRENITFVKIEQPKAPLDYDKYANQNWIFNYTPQYELRRDFYFQKKKAELFLKVEKGNIVELKISGLNNKITLELNKKLIGKQHVYNIIENILSKISKEALLLTKYFF